MKTEQVGSNLISVPSNNRLSAPALMPVKMEKLILVGSDIKHALASLDCQNLLSDHGEHLKVDAIEFIKARPSSARCKTLLEYEQCLTLWLNQMFTDFEELSEGNVVKTVGTIEDDTLFGNSFSQILCGLCLACSSRTLRGTSEMQMQRTEQSTVATIGQRRNHQTSGVAQILVTIFELRVDHSCSHIILLTYKIMRRVFNNIFSHTSQ
jgi:hypothetical protein